MVVSDPASKDGSALLFVRGGTTTIGRLLHKDSMPADYHKVRLAAHQACIPDMTGFATFTVMRLLYVLV